MREDDWADLVERFTDGEVTRGHMFGCPGLRTGRRFFTIRWEEQLVLKLPAARIADLVQAGGGTPFEPMEGRRMNGWILLTGAADTTSLVEQARAYVTEQHA
ncbi:TfoX/Sxy family protein [Blastococcus montanus]|uniref:TfoX/Sxy family protein n=1 Tax=Blastococcus montanus TaxID=3144973 RepID=UPI00320A65AF